MKNVASFVVGIFISGIVLCLGCPPTPQAPPDPSPSPAPATCASACVNLRNLGCPEGLLSDCPATCEDTASKVNYHLDCLAGAQSVAAAQACGSVDCDVESLGAAATCQSACAQVKKFGCPEAADCLATCSKEGSKINFKLSCLARAKTKSALQACGSVACK
jgi:hypothetical protein